MHTAVALEPGIQSIEEHRQVESRCVLHGAPHDQGALDRTVCIANADATGFSKCCHIGELFSGQIPGQGAQRVDPGTFDSPGPLSYHVNHCRCVNNGFRISRAAHTGDSSRHSSAQFAEHGGLVFLSRFSQPGLQVDQPRTDDKPGRVEDQVVRTIATGT